MKYSLFGIALAIVFFLMFSLIFMKYMSYYGIIPSVLAILFSCRPIEGSDKWAWHKQT